MEVLGVLRGLGDADALDVTVPDRHIHARVPVDGDGLPIAGRVQCHAHCPFSVAVPLADAVSARPARMARAGRKPRPVSRRPGAAPRPAHASAAAHTTPARSPNSRVPGAPGTPSP